MHTTQHTRTAHTQEKIAKAFIWASVIITIGILSWIVLYVMVRGFYFNKDKVYQVINIRETELALGPGIDSAMTVIVNKGVRVDDLTIESLRTLFTKSRTENWGHYTRQDMKAYPVAFQPGTAFTQAAYKLIVGTEEGFGKYINYAASPEEMVHTVARNAGAIGYLPSDAGVDLGAVKIVPVRRVSIAVHPSVRKIENNIQIQQLDSEQLSMVFSGEAQNWRQLGGIDLPVVPVLPPIDDPLYGSIGDYLHGETELSDSVIMTESLEEFCSVMENTDGAVGLCFYDAALEKEFPVLEYIRNESGWNLSIPFLIEPPARSGQWGGISYIIINTFFLILFTLIFSTPIGILAAIYLVEYAKQGKIVSVLRMGTETLAGIPSIVFGLFGNIFFVNMLGMGIGFISSTLTVTMMILPTIIRTSEEALKAVPPSYREGSLALGATKLQTIFKVVLPAAVPGILTGVILGVGRVVGETAVLLYTLGSNYELVRGPSSSARVLSLHLYFLFSEAISFDRAFATGAILIFIVLIVNFTTTKLISRVNRMAGK
jgi:phosphate transport system permease protein